MTKNKTVTHYAKITHGQPNMNQSDAKSRRDWGNVQLSCSTDGLTKPQGDSDSFYEYSKIGKSVVKGKPWTFTGHDFNFDIPSCAYIKRIVFKVRMMIDGKIVVKVPRARFNFYHGTKNVSNNIKENTGWKDNVYFSTPNQNIPHTFQDIEYVMSGEDFRKRGYPISELNEERMGIDLNWWDSVKNTSYNSVRIQYVSCTVEYEMPDQSVSFDEVTNGDNPLLRDAGVEFGVAVEYRNRSNAGCCDGTAKKIKIDLPPNVDVRVLNGDFNLQTSEWTVNCTPNNFQVLLLGITDYGIGEKTITASNSDIAPTTLWYYSSPVENDVGRVTPYPDTYMQKGVMSCITFKSVVQAGDGEATFNIDMAEGETYSNVKWSIVENETDNNISLKSDECNDHKAVFNVPQGEVVQITFKGCFVPKFTGNTGVTVNLDGREDATAPYNCLDAPHFVLRNESKTDETNRGTAEIVLNPCIINFVTHRIASTTELGAYVIDCGVAPFDNAMVEKECTLTADAWEPVDYIGPVPLEYHHYDPESTYSNKAVSDAYKNKTYKGKEGIIDEKISLKWKCRPWEAPTFQGLTKLDKPTPINANHKCFEGDPLNHRGWAVLSEVKINRTNPLWYDMEGDVDYITHDIYTKFQIFKGLTVNSTAMPDLTAEVFSQGENLAEGLDIFDVDTDGGFIYDEDGDETAKNIFSLDEGQHLNIKTLKQLADVSIIDFEWYSTCINEKRENNIERVFRLVNENGESILEYEYTNFQFNEDYVTCDVVVRVKTDDGWKEPIYFYDVDLRTELEAELIEDDDDNSVIEEDEIDGDEPEGEDYDADVIDTDDETAYEEGYIAPTINVMQYNITEIYGSTLQFVLKGNNLKIFDAGYNGSEITSEDIELVAGKYYFECVWKNNNHDGTTEDIISYIDVGLSETILNTDYSEYYSNLMVSPFPIPYKKVVFTRESEEGTIYYLTGEEPFKYLLEPFYQYHCGCDLLGDRTSIFDLDNSYTHYYIENGLVRLGFNKYNVRLYLAKYDPITSQWITTHYFHMTKEPKFSVESYSDDKIVIKAGTDTFFIIWRGRPYIGIKNPTDAIYIDSNFNYCLSDMIEDDKYDYPIIHSFMNTWNLLPNGVGGKRVDSDDIIIDDDMEVITTPHTVTIPAEQLTDIIAKEDTTITPTITPSTTTGKAHLIVDGVDVAESETPFTLSYNFPSEGNYKVYIAYVGATDEDDIAISQVYDVRVATPSPVNPDQDEHKEIAGNYNLTIVSAPKKMTYRDGSKVIVELKKGTTPVKDVIEIPLPNGQTITKYTRNNDGRYEIINDSGVYFDSHTLFVPGKWQWGARFYDPTASDVNAKKICEALKYITIEKAKPTFTHNDADGKVSKGKNLTVKLNGVDSKANPNKAGLAGKKVTYSINGGKKVSAKTDENGKFKVKFNSKGTKKLKVMFAGSVRYQEISKTFTIKVV